MDRGESKQGSAENKRIKLNVWMLASIVFALLFVLSLIFRGGTGITGNVISNQEAGSKTLSLINDYFITEGSATLTGIEEESNLYKVNLLYNSQVTPVYITKDGKYLIMPNGLVDIAQLEATASQQGEEQPEAETPKSNKPVVELFVMTHCPYGTQAEKGLIPVLELLGDSIDGKIRFVHYFMHGDKEEQETYRQVCIREEQPEKYLDYLKCFLEAGNSEECLGNANIDKAKLDSCIKDKSEGYYAEDSALSEEYGVRGSPTLVVNGVIVSSARSPAAYLSTICSAFNAPAEECTEQLSSTTPGAGFGYEGSGTGQGSC